MTIKERIADLKDALITKLNELFAAIPKYTAGTNIQITNDNIISATNTTYSAGTKALIEAGTNTTNRIWSAKILADYILAVAAGEDIDLSDYLKKSGGTMTGQLSFTQSERDFIELQRTGTNAAKWLLHLGYSHFNIGTPDNANLVAIDKNGNMKVGAHNSTSAISYRLEVDGTFRTVGKNTLSNLSGSGTRMVVANSSGELTTKAIPDTGDVDLSEYVKKLTLQGNGVLGGTLVSGNVSNFNSINTDDFYIGHAANSASNAPSSNYFWVMQSPRTTGDHLFQFGIRYSGSGNQEFWLRTRSGSSWDSWKRLAFTTDLPSAGTAALLSAGTNTIDRVWSAKVLADQLKKADNTKVIRATEEGLNIKPFQNDYNEVIVIYSGESTISVDIDSAANHKDRIISISARSGSFRLGQDVKIGGATILSGVSPGYGLNWRIASDGSNWYVI